MTQLRGEKIDVVPWSEDPSTYVANALQPAKVKEVRTDPETQTALVIVPDYQLSLAIGKEGQNARLAARLTGWRIDIKSETQFGEEQRKPRVESEAAGSTDASVEAAPATDTAAPAEVAASATEAPTPVPAETPPQEPASGDVTTVPDAGDSSARAATDAASSEEAPAEPEPATEEAGT